MKISTKVSALLGGGAVALITLLFGLTSTASADCVYQYNQNGFITSTTPVFNSICGVPNGVGDEANFVRIRQDVVSGHNDEDNNDNPAYSIGSINAACSNDERFDVWNYVHNNASQNNNPDVGNGSAVANGTFINMSAPVGQTSNSFSFTATVGANNAASVTNMTPAVINCGSNQVQLSLVPGSVHTYSIPYAGWQNLSDSSLNTNLPLGSTNAGLSSLGTGTMWGCFNYRIVVIYQVKTTPLPPKQTPPTCNSITNDEADIESVNFTANSATVNDVSLDLFSGTSTSGTPLASVKTVPHDFTGNTQAGQQYTIVATVETSMGNVTNANCQVTFTTPTTPPPSTPPPSTPPPAQLINTGPGSVIGIFAGTAIGGTAFYHWILKRRLAKR